jgi:hypothetical protein
MQVRSRSEIYSAFIEFIGNDVQGERRAVNRRMFNVLVWCFILPAMVSLIILTLVKFKWLPGSLRAYVGWLGLIFPVVYSLYILGSEVLYGIPNTFRRGGIATSLTEAHREGVWRERVLESLRRAFPDAQSGDWHWIASSYRMDLEHMHHRTKYLTAMAGAVFYLIMQGIDSLSDESKVTWVKTPLLGWVENSSFDVAQYVGLAIVLMLLYLSGTQTHRTLTRYLNCVELLDGDKPAANPARA